MYRFINAIFLILALSCPVMAMLDDDEDDDKKPLLPDNIFAVPEEKLPPEPSLWNDIVSLFSSPTNTEVDEEEMMENFENDNLLAGARYGNFDAVLTGLDDALEKKDYKKIEQAADMAKNYPKLAAFIPKYKNFETEWGQLEKDLETVKDDKILKETQEKFDEMKEVLYSITREILEVNHQLFLEIRKSKDFHKINEHLFSWEVFFQILNSQEYIKQYEGTMLHLFIMHVKEYIKNIKESEQHFFWNRKVWPLLIDKKYLLMTLDDIQAKYPPEFSDRQWDAKELKKALFAESLDMGVLDALQKSPVADIKTKYKDLREVAGIAADKKWIPLYIALQPGMWKFFNKNKLRSWILWETSAADFGEEGDWPIKY
jgi:hypothetical protein